jgi:hypothetical protein
MKEAGKATEFSAASLFAQLKEEGSKPEEEGDSKPQAIKVDQVLPPFPGF